MTQNAPKYIKLLEERVERLEAENARLKRGDLTDEELQNLCHNLDENDREAFCDGCDEYQRKLFGRSRTGNLEASWRAAQTVALDLLIRCWKAGHRQGWQDGETNAEVFDAVNNFLTDKLGPRWGEEFASD